MPRLEAVSTNIIRRIGVIQTGTGAGLTPEEKERIGLEIFEPGQESRPDSLAGRLHQLEQELDRIERESGDQGQALSEIIDNLDKIAQEIASAREGRPSLADNIKDIRDLINSLLKKEWLSFEKRESFTAIAGQTEFVLTKFTYEPGSGHLWVFRNGVWQSPGEDRDYVELDESTIRFNEPLEEGELINCVLFGKPGSGQQPGSSGGSLSDDLLIQNTINLAKTNFKLNAHIAATRERLSGLIIDVFSDTSGIDEELSRAWGYNPERKEIHALTDLVWEESFTKNAPPARYHHSLTYDSARGVVVLFGGRPGAGMLNDTWEYDGTDWREINTPTKPPARYGHSLTYDSARGVVVLFGGNAGSSLNDTWEYDGTNWRQINTPTKPPVSYYHSLTYDSARGVVVLFGGRAGANDYSDTWEYDGTDWRRINTPTKPPARYYHSLTYDSARGVVVLFGGSVSGIGRYNDTWEYDGTDWRQINTPTKPPIRDGHSLTYDSARGVVVLFGGYGGSPLSPLNDTWEYDGSDWREINTHTKPPAHYYNSLTYDSARGAVVLFGGNGSSGQLNDTWEYYDNIDPAEVVSSADILDSRPSYIYFVSHTPESPPDASIQYQMSLDDGKTWFSVSPEELIQVKSNINSSDPPIIRAKAIISAGGRLSGWAYGWV